MKWDPSRVALKRVILISGSEDLLRLEALRAIQAVAGVGEDDFDSETVIADAKPPQDWIASVSTLPFLANRRTLFVRNLLRVDPESVPANLLEQIPETGRLVLVADEEGSGSEDRSTKHKKALDGWIKRVTAKTVDGHHVACDVSEGQLLDEITARVKARGKKISRPAAELLTEMVGAQYSRALSELEKVLLYVGEEEQIREEHVKAAVTATREWSIWTLLDAVRDQRLGEAVRQLRILVDSPKKIESVAIATVLPQFTRYYRLLWQARVCVEHNVHPAQAPESISSMFPVQHFLPKEKPGTINRLMPQARRVQFDQIRACIEEIAEADAKLKGIDGTVDAFEILERLLMKLIAIQSGPTSRVRA